MDIEKELMIEWLQHQMIDAEQDGDNVRFFKLQTKLNQLKS